MSIYGYAEFSLALASAFGNKDAAKWAKKYFRGDLDIVLGTKLESVFGSRLQHNFGSRREVVDASMYGMGALVGFLTDPLASLLGMSGKTDCVLGRQSTLTYGGPIANFHRGPRLRRITEEPVGWSKKPVDPIQLTFFQTRIDRSEPRDNAGVVVSEQASADSRCVGILASLLSLSTAALELALYFLYVDANSDQESSKNADQQDCNPFSTPSLLRSSASSLSAALMGVICLYEKSSAKTSAGTYLLTEAKNALIRSFSILFVPYAAGKCLGEAMNCSIRLAMLLGVVFQLLAILAVAVALVAI